MEDLAQTVNSATGLVLVPVESLSKEQLKELNLEARKSFNEEIGEDEIPQTERFQLAQKYGVVKPILDKRIEKPSWVQENGGKSWKYQAMIWRSIINQALPPRPKFQPKPISKSPASGSTYKPYQKPKPWSEIKHKKFSPKGDFQDKLAKSLHLPTKTKAH